MKKQQVLIPLAAGLSALGLVGSMGVASAMQSHPITLSVDGSEQSMQVREDTVGDVLQTQGIELGENDVVLPSPETKIADDMAITVLVARPLEVTVDGEKREVWTTGRTVGEALGFLDLDAHDSKFSTSRSAGIGREGLSVDIMTAKDVTVTTADGKADVRVAGTVADALAKEGVKPDSDDIVNLPEGKVLVDGMDIVFTEVEVKESTKDVAIPFDKKTEQSSEMLKGKTEVKTKGVEGIKRETYEDTYHDGKKVKSEKLGEEVLKQPVTQVTLEGTKEVPQVAAGGASLPAPTGGSRSGGKYDWMAAAGIPQSDWQYVDYIVSRESGWNPSAVNRSSGACGLVQALPCSKLGGNWQDPVHALRWQHQYVQSRYGGYAGAYSFWTRNHWY